MMLENESLSMVHCSCKIKLSEFVYDGKSFNMVIDDVLLTYVVV